MARDLYAASPSSSTTWTQETSLKTGTHPTTLSKNQLLKENCEGPGSNNNLSMIFTRLQNSVAMKHIPHVAPRRPAVSSPVPPELHAAGLEDVNGWLRHDDALRSQRKWLARLHPGTNPDEWVFGYWESGKKNNAEHPEKKAACSGTSIALASWFTAKACSRVLNWVQPAGAAPTKKSRRQLFDMNGVKKPSFWLTHSYTQRVQVPHIGGFRTLWDMLRHAQYICVCFPRRVRGNWRVPCCFCVDLFAGSVLVRPCTSCPVWVLKYEISCFGATKSGSKGETKTSRQSTLGKWVD